MNLIYFQVHKIEIARVISSTFKSLMEIQLFQCSQVSIHPEWITQIDAWFIIFEIGVNF